MDGKFDIRKRKRSFLKVVENRLDDQRQNETDANLWTGASIGDFGFSFDDIQTVKKNPEQPPATDVGLDDRPSEDRGHLT